MITLELSKILLWILPHILQIYGETCHRFRPKRRVDIDPAMCEYHNFTAEQESFLCHEHCLNMDQVRIKLHLQDGGSGLGLIHSALVQVIS